MDETILSGDRDEIRDANKRHSHPLARAISLLWLLAVTIYFLWEAWSYSGLFARISEWEYARLNRAFPSLNTILLILLFSLPSLLLIYPRKRKNAQDEGAGAAEGPAAMGLVTIVRRGVQIVLGATCVAALAALVMGLTIPFSAATNRTIAVGQPGSEAPASGPARLVGAPIPSQAVTMVNRLAGDGRPMRFLPVVAPGAPEGAARYFIQFYDDGAASVALPATGTFNGVLVRNGLPGPIASLYRSIGQSVPAPHYVLYASASAARWPYFVTAGQFAICALLLLGLLLLQGRRLKRLRSNEKALTTG